MKKLIGSFIVTIIAITITIASTTSTLSSYALADDETVYVQAAKTKLLSDAQMNAGLVSELKRGDSLKVLKKQGLWLQVSVNGASDNAKKAASLVGWISKITVGPNPPVGEAEISAKLGDDKNLTKAARRRASSYSVSASSRGLASGNRQREGRETYESDPKAVEKMEKQGVPEKDVNKFKKDVKLGE